LATVGLGGVTAMDTRVGGVTVSVWGVLVIVPDAAVILVEPTASELAKPDPLMLTTLGAEEFHVAVLVKFAVVESVYVPVAVNCCVIPLATEGFVGVTAIEASAAALTANTTAELVTLPPASLTTTSKVALLSAEVVGGVVYTGNVAPVIFAPFFCHW
jgi:hypothetical protein